MSLHVVTRVYERKIGDHIAKAVLAKIADNANDAGVAWPSIRYLSETTEIPERTIKRKIAWLIDAGWLSVRKSRAKGGQWGHNVYQVCLPDLPGDTVAHGASDRGPREVTTVGQSLAQEPSVESSPSGGRALARTRTDAGTLTAHFVDEYRLAAGQDPPKRTVKQLASEAKKLLDEGADSETVKRAVSLMIEKRLSPSTLPSMMLEAAAGPRRTRRFARGVTADEMLTKARNTKRLEDLNETLRSRNGAGPAPRGLPPGGD